MFLAVFCILSTALMRLFIQILPIFFLKCPHASLIWSLWRAAQLRTFFHFLSAFILRSYHQRASSWALEYWSTRITHTVLSDSQYREEYGRTYQQTSFPTIPSESIVTGIFSSEMTFVGNGPCQISLLWAF